MVQTIHRGPLAFGIFQQINALGDEFWTRDPGSDRAPGRSGENVTISRAALSRPLRCVGSTPV